MLTAVSFDVDQEEIVAVLGPSGCGKSTLLSLVAGLEMPDQGEILWNGESLTGIPPRRRNFGLMFQDYALFPHRNVYENMAFGLQMANRSRAPVQKGSASTGPGGPAGFRAGTSIHSPAASRSA